jgi:hypothetical protein
VAGGGTAGGRGGEPSEENGRVRGTGVRQRAGGPAGGDPRAGPGGSVGQADELPATTRIGGRRGAGRGLQLTLTLAAVALVLAVLKPWNLLAPPPPAPGRQDGALPVASNAAPPPSNETAPAGNPARVGCFADDIWEAVTDQVDGPTSSRSWTRLDVAPASGPTDPSIATIAVFADAVPRIGFCAPVRTSAFGAVAGASTFSVRTWRLVHPSREPEAWMALAIDPVVVAGGTLADRGALFGPTADAAGIPVPASPDPEGAWSAAGSAAPRPAGWSPDGETAAAPGSWLPGRYVFRVELAGAGPGGTDATWFAIELRGQWTGPDVAPATGTPMGTPAATPTSPPVP